MGEIVRLPSGLTGEMRGLTGKEARLLSDKQAIKSGLFFERMLSSCWLQTTDPGPYAFGIGDAKTAPVDWSKVLTGDRVAALIKIRCRTFSDDTFGCKLQCPACRKRFDHVVNLAELPVKELSDEDAEGFRNGNSIEGTLPDGQTFHFRLGIGQDEIDQMKKGAVTNFVAPMVAKIHDIEGDTDTSNIRRHFDNVELGYCLATLREMDQHACGIDTTIEADCPECGHLWDLEVPLGQGFLSPPPPQT